MTLWQSEQKNRIITFSEVILKLLKVQKVSQEKVGREASNSFIEHVEKIRSFIVVCPSHIKTYFRVMDFGRSYTDQWSVWRTYNWANPPFSTFCLASEDMAHGDPDHHDCMVLFFQS